MKVCMITSSYPRHAGDGAGSFVGSLAQALAAQGHSVGVLAPWDAALASAPRHSERSAEPHRTVDETLRSAQADTTPIVRRFRYAPMPGLHIAGHGRALDADTRLRFLAPLLMPSFVLCAVLSALAWARRERAAGSPAAGLRAAGAPFDVIHGHWAVPGGFIAALVGRLTRTPVVISLHGSDVFVIRRNRLYGAAARWAFRRAARVVVCSHDLRARALQAGLAPERSEVIPYGVDATRYGQERAAEALALRQRWGVPAGAPLIGALGRMVHKKGFDHLIAALPRVLQAVPEARCVIGGAGDLQVALRAQAQTLGLGERVLFPGAVDWQVTPAFYAACDVLAVPSVVDAHGNVDGLPNVLLEAMASRCAIVGSDVAGIPDVLRDGENGLLVAPGDESALGEALVRLLADADLRTRLGAAARHTVAQDYAWEGAARQYERVYVGAWAKVRA